MGSFGSPTRPGAFSKRDPRAQYPTPVPEDLHVTVDLQGRTVIPMQNSHCRVPDFRSAPYAQEFAFLCDPAATAREACLYDPLHVYPFGQSLPAYPSPSAGSDTLSEEASTPSGAAFISPAMDARSFPSHHSFASLNSHGEFGVCVDPNIINTAQSPQIDGANLSADADLPQVEGGPKLSHEHVSAVDAPSPCLPIMENAQYMGDAADSHSLVTLALEPSQHVAYDPYIGCQVAVPQPLGSGLSPAAFPSSPSRRLAVIPRMSSKGSTKSNTGLGRGSRVGGEKGGGVYPCLFQSNGCPRGFLGKNEWKRHISTIHVRWDVWVCAEGDCASIVTSWAPSMILGEPSFPRKGKVFNRKDLYIMHLGRRHHHLLPPRPSIEKKQPCLEQERIAAKACHRRIQLHGDMKGIECSLMGCNEAFGGSSAWDSFLEHVANHPRRALQSPRGAVEMGSWMNESLMSFGVSPGFLCEDRGGRWRLCDPIWNEGPKGKKGGITSGPAATRRTGLARGQQSLRPQAATQKHTARTTAEERTDFGLNGLSLQMPLVPFLAVLLTASAKTIYELAIRGLGNVSVLCFRLFGMQEGMVALCFGIPRV